MSKEYKVEIEAIDVDNTSIKKTYFTGNHGEYSEYLQELILSQKCDSARAVVSMWNDDTQDWYEYRDVTYFKPNLMQDYYLLKNGEHEYRIKHSFIQEQILHLPSKIVFMVSERRVEYAKELLESPECLFYDFQYVTESGKEYNFTACCNLIGSKKPHEELQQIKEKILKPGTEWFCKHLREAYKSYFDEDPYSKIERKKKDLHSDL